MGKHMMQVKETRLKYLIFSAAMLVYIPSLHSFFTKKNFYARFGNNIIADGFFAMFILLVVCLAYYFAGKCARLILQRNK
jgi:hypothetical protein